jgi:hypothetical protein
MQRGVESSEAKGRNNWERMRKRNCFTRGESFFKADSPARASRPHRKSRPMHTKATQPMTWGPGSTSHTAGVLVSKCEEGEPPREERTAARASSSSLKTTARSMTRGPRPTSHTPWASVPGCRKSKPPLAPVLRLLEVAVEDREGDF